MKLRYHLLFVAALSTAPLAIVNAQVPIPAADRVGTTPGTLNGLNGNYWQRAPKEILTDGETNPANSITLQIDSFGAPTGTFEAHGLSYLGNDLTDIPTWLAGDAATFTGPPSSNLDDGAFRFLGFLYIPTAGTYNYGTNTDDGSRIRIGSVEVVNNDSGHGDRTRSSDVSFTDAGLYPFQVDYFNGDWTDAGGNHGGANFRLLESGAPITETNLYRNVPEPSAVLMGLASLGGMLALRRRRR